MFCGYLRNYNIVWRLYLLVNGYFIESFFVIKCYSLVILDDVKLKER